MKILITGRIGSGRKYLANLLKEQGMKIAESAPNGIIPKEADLYIASPDEIEVITKNMPAENFVLVYVQAEDIERRFNFVKKSDKKIEKEKEFDSIDENEDSVFCKLEDHIIKGDTEQIPENLIGIYRYVNNYSPSKAEHYATFINRNITLNHIMVNVLNKLVNANILRASEKDPSKIIIINSKNEQVESDKEYLAESLLQSPQQFQDAMEEYLLMENGFCKKKNP